MNNVKQIPVQSNQTLFDIALQEYGGIESVFELLAINDSFTLNTNVAVGKQINISSNPLPINKKVLAYYLNKTHVPSSSSDFVLNYRSFGTSFSNAFN